ncbi:hypothetical protein AVEN_45536-1 [Araneus ventricosus]|uniref:Uncharacterized protein n=1 Tax=Araneus ventricosus TaxID=182803 RepID=A0A4Y2F1L0_ARAVE|nr:hypothetical protein AVEN_45536-1 [Araneus ventricosus]
MAQRGQERRAEKTDEQRNSRLSAMLQHARERRINVIEGQNHHQIQTFYAARTVLYPIVEEHNCGEMDNLCLKCGCFFRCLKEKEELHGMLPVDSRQLVNVKGEFLKLTKKETMAQRSLDRRAEETEEQNNSRLSDMAQRSQERRVEENRRTNE